MEFDVIRRFFLPLSHGLARDSADLAIGDDGALITPPPNHQLVVVTDTLVAGVHFPLATSAYDIGWKALAVNLSDLAAMGAQPAFYSLALTLPQVDQAWLTDFSQGLADCAQPYRLLLIGGDTTRGPLTVTVTAQGWVPHGQALLRSGAQVGDCVYVSEWMGEAGLGLSLALAEQIPTNVGETCALARLNRPVARVALGIGLRGLATSAIDISDGLLADLTHVLTASKVGATLTTDLMPVSETVKSWAAEQPLKPLTAGDDYELCFTAPPDQQTRIEQLADQLNLKITRIGEVTLQPGLVIDGEKINPSKLGFDHFKQR